MRNGWKRFDVTIGWLAIAALWVTLFALSVQPASAAADKTLHVYVDGVKSDWDARSSGGNTYLDLDAVADLGGKVSSTDNLTYTVSADRNEVRFTVGEKTIYVDGTPQQSVMTATAVNNRVYVPVSWISKTLGMKSLDDPMTGSLFLFHPVKGTADAITPLTPVFPGFAPAKPSDVPVTISDALPTLEEIAVTEAGVDIRTTGSVAHQSFQLKGPDRIVIDFPNAAVEKGTNGIAAGAITVDPNHPFISGVRYSHFNTEPSSARIVIDLKTPKYFVTETLPEGRGAAVRFVERKPIAVMIDAGHGGSDPGAISRTGQFEKDVNLPIANKVIRLLEQETLIQPVALRTDDIYISPMDRAALANLSGAELFISIHANTADSPGIKGTETYYWRDDSLAFANLVHNKLVPVIGSIDRKVKKERFVVVRETTMPAVLLELGFLTNAEDEAKLYNSAMQDRIAEAIVSAIKEYYSIS